MPILSIKTYNEIKLYTHKMVGLHMDYIPNNRSLLPVKSIALAIFSLKQNEF